jgi:uncharacterized membrane protein YccC
MRDPGEMAAASQPPNHRGLLERARRWRPTDPGLAGLRRASRAALVMPAAFAFAKLVLRDPQATTFVAFGCFSLIVLADFGGMRRPRAVAYLVATGVGAALVALGTLATPLPWLAALAMLVVGFWIQFAGVFGGYTAASQTALMLAFVLAVSVPAPPEALAPRVGGWLLAGAVSTVACILLWPRFERVQLMRRAATACHALGGLIAAWRHHPDSEEERKRKDEATAAVHAARDAYAATARRPAGPTRRDRALVELLGELQRGLKFATKGFGRRPAMHPRIEQGDRLTTVVVGTLEASGDLLRGGEPPDLAALASARLAHREALDAWAGQELRAGRSPEDVLDGLDADHWLRVLSFLALGVGTNAIIVSGRRPDGELPLPAGTPRHTGASGVVRRVARTIRAHLVPGSAALRNSLRAGLGLALAVLLARLLRLDHGFWVVLGTLSVLRTSALSTGRTTAAALAGTFAGFVIGGAFMWGVGSGSTPALWAALPVAVFVAAYATSAIGFAVGQAAFTALVIVLFNLILPVGWTLGLVRIEDVSAGAGISVAIGLLLWPRGARTAMVGATAGMFRAMAQFLESSFRRVLEGAPAGDADRDRRGAVRAQEVAGDSLEQFLNERGAKPIDPQAAASLVSMGNALLLVADALNVAADIGYEATACAGGAVTTSRAVTVEMASIRRLADRLEGLPGPERTVELVGAGPLDEAAVACLRAWDDSPQGGHAAIAVAAAREWLLQMNRVLETAEEAVAPVVRAARVPWWSG